MRIFFQESHAACDRNSEKSVRLYPNEERSTKKDATEKEATLVCSRWEMMHMMRNVTSQHIHFATSLNRALLSERSTRERVEVSSVRQLVESSFERLVLVDGL